MLDFHDEEARKSRGGPLLIKLVGLFLLNAVVAGDVEALAVVGFEICIRRLGSKPFEILREWPSNTASG
jgi:hypothetical protein